MRAFVPMLVVLALTAPAAGADHCESWWTSQPELTAGTGDTSTYYVDVDCPPIFCTLDIMSIHVYEESNGVAGLQRYDEWVDDTCHGMIDGDTVVL